VAEAFGQRERPHFGMVGVRRYDRVGVPRRDAAEEIKGRDVGRSSWSAQPNVGGGSVVSVGVVSVRAGRRAV
jgi:hypothetical protein